MLQYVLKKELESEAELSELSELSESKTQSKTVKNEDIDIRNKSEESTNLLEKDEKLTIS